jgi:ArsR family transcriptional regulator
MKTKVSPQEQISTLLGQIQQLARIQILFIIDREETCVCHIESILGIRQAAISQHLMALRKAGLLTTRRAGRHIYYRLADQEILDLLQHAGRFLRISESLLIQLSLKPYPGCNCPQCKPDPVHNQVC